MLGHTCPGAVSREARPRLHCRHRPMLLLQWPLLLFSLLLLLLLLAVLLVSLRLPYVLLVLLHLPLRHYFDHFPQVPRKHYHHRWYSNIDSAQRSSKPNYGAALSLQEVVLESTASPSPCLLLVSLPDLAFTLSVCSLFRICFFTT